MIKLDLWDLINAQDAPEKPVRKSLMDDEMLFRADRMTVSDLRAALQNLPDYMEVIVCSQCGSGTPECAQFVEVQQHETGRYLIIASFL